MPEIKRRARRDDGVVVVEAAPPGEWRRPWRGNDKGAPLVIIAEPQSHQAASAGLPMELEALKWLAQRTGPAGLDRDDFLIISLCPPIPELALTSDSRKWNFVKEYLPELEKWLAPLQPKLFVTMGDLATRAMVGRSTAITKARGVPIFKDGRAAPIFPMLSPNFVRRIPDHDPTFKADVGTLARLKSAGWDVGTIAASEPNYRYVSDLEELMEPIEAMVSKGRTPVLAFDTETTGLVWWEAATRVILNQFSYQPGESFMAPTHPLYFEKVFNDPNPGARAAALQVQVKRVLEDPRFRKIGHNIKFDHQISAREGIEVKGWLHDTQLMAFFADENMMSMSLDDCTRIWAPELGGYADLFNAHTNKSRMMDVPPDDVVDQEGKIVTYGMRNYAGGDTDACFRVAQRLDKILREDARQYQCYRRVQMPALLAFAKVVERYGLPIDKDALRTLGAEVDTYAEAKYNEIVRLIPPTLRRDYLRRGKEISFTVPATMQDILFGEKGFKLKPVVFTKSTAKLPPDQRVPSVSAKDHMPYFEDAPGNAGLFVTGYIDYLKQQKLATTYIGKEELGNGFWQYIAPDGAIYPSYKLHATVTGRSASDNPNGQNFPKRGRFAKAYNKIFQARPGYKLVSADLSQIELRIAAWMANETTMLDIYRADGDIHASTGAAASGWTDEFFNQHKSSDAILLDVANDFHGAGQWLQSLNPGARRTAKVRDYLKLQRQKGKPINFGYLYGMSWEGFKVYAKTTYQQDFTDEEAETSRTRFFTKYSKLPAWHNVMKKFVKDHGYVRSLHGAIRHLPSIYSTDRMIRSEAERQAINSPVQRFGSDLGLMALWRFSYQAMPDTFRILGFIHDALVMEVKDGHEIEGIKALLYAMENPPLEEYFNITAPLPIKAEADIGLSFGEMFELGDLPSGEKQPDWMKELDMTALAGAKAEKPEWWSEDWREVERQFMVERETRRLVFNLES